ncbi:MAG: amino acid ABC transporter substrate-binding protein [Vulcanimicrobiaceae bacterium]
MFMLSRLIAIVVAFASTVGQGAAQRPTILFGSPIALTGSLANEGKLTKEGYDFWAQYVNAHGGLRVGSTSYDVAIRYADDGSDPHKTAVLLEDMIVNGHINFILSPYGSAAAFSASAVAERHGVPMVVSSGSAERIYSQGYHYIFDVQSPARKYLTGVIELAVRRTPRPQTLAISSASDGFSLEVQQGVAESANDHGIHVVYNDHYGDAPDAVSATVTAIKAVNPDIVLNAGHLKDALEMQRDLKAQHVSAKIYGYTVGPDSPAFRQTLGRDAEGVMGSSQWSSAVTYNGEPGFYQKAQDYAAAFTRAYGHAPDYHDGEASAAGLAFQYALANAGTLDRTAVRDALAHLQVETFFGVLKFDSRGMNVYKPMVINQIQNGNLVTVYPYRLANAKPLYPAPAWSY